MGKLFHSIKFKWWYCVLVGLATIIDGLTMLLTLGRFTTHLAMRLGLYAVTKNIYRKTKRKKS